MAFYPVLSELYERDKRLFIDMHGKLRLLMLGLGVPIAIIGTILSDHTIKLLYGPKYAGSKFFFEVMVWLVPLYFLRFIYGIAILVMRKEQKYAIAGGCGLITTTATLCFMIFSNNYIVSAFALLMGEFAIAISLFGLFNFYSKSILVGIASEGTVGGSENRTNVNRVRPE
jgi:O-antigen/teichoic acid export membrane protein